MPWYTKMPKTDKRAQVIGGETGSHGYLQFEKWEGLKGVLTCGWNSEASVLAAEFGWPAEKCVVNRPSLKGKASTLKHENVYANRNASSSNVWEMKQGKDVSQ